jgi:hypothetical protein
VAPRPDHPALYGQQPGIGSLGHGGRASRQPSSSRQRRPGLPRPGDHARRGNRVSRKPARRHRQLLRTPGADGWVSGVGCRVSGVGR